MYKKKHVGQQYTKQHHINKLKEMMCVQYFSDMSMYIYFQFKLIISVYNHQLFVFFLYTKLIEIYT